MNVSLPIQHAEFKASGLDVFSLNKQVHATIAAHTEFNPDQIVTQDNRVKYQTPNNPYGAHTHLDEVFQLMRGLNEIGLRSDIVGRLSAEGMSFQGALKQSCSLVAKQLSGRPLTYVELGPEPVKTKFILQTLLEFGVRINRYIAVDINPMSPPHMRQALTEILPSTQLDFATAAFDNFQPDPCIEEDGSTALITMLGFQEGNDDPLVVNEWLRNIAKPGDLLLSESQLFNVEHVSKISEFYADPLMRRFSRIAFEQAINSATPTLNRFFLLPVVLSDGMTVNAAILGEEFHISTGERHLYVSNFCLKYTYEQYIYYRKFGKFFEISEEIFTDDKTLHFQLSRRV